jgi:hypothetical protein
LQRYFIAVTESKICEYGDLFACRLFSECGIPNARVPSHTGFGEIIFQAVIRDRSGSAFAFSREGLTDGLHQGT